MRIDEPPKYMEGNNSPFIDQSKVFELEASLLSIPLINNIDYIPSGIVNDIGENAIDVVSTDKNKDEVNKQEENRYKIVIQELKAKIVDAYKERSIERSKTEAVNKTLESKITELNAQVENEKKRIREKKSAVEEKLKQSRSEVESLEERSSSSTEHSNETNVRL